jgi:hypothetical protein
MSFVSEAIGSAPDIPSDDRSVIFFTVDCKNVNIKASITMINRLNLSDTSAYLSL